MSLVVIYQWGFFLHPWWVLDLIVFVGTNAVEGFHHEEGAAAARKTLRVWRLVRVLHAVAVAVELEWHEASELSRLRGECAELRERNIDLVQRLSRLQAELNKDDRRRNVALPRVRASGGGGGGGGGGNGLASGIGGGRGGGGPGKTGGGVVVSGRRDREQSGKDA